MIMLAQDLAMWTEVAKMGALAALLIFQHRDNLARLSAGTESKIGQKAK
jgi:glycerol-3-phosphate acyltransferase PlsY